MALERLHWYSETEEKFNIRSHALGIFLSFVGLILLLIKGESYSFLGAAGFIVYGLSQILIYASSTFYHSQKNPKKRYVANIVDHAMIFVSIAGTYTPFCLISLRGHGGISLLITVWTIALAGMILKIKFTGKYNLLSTIIYVAMGWLIVLYAREFFENVPIKGIYWLMAGGIAYTVGAILYIIDRIPFNHAVFHVFILLGSICHFLAIYFYT